MKKLLFTSLLGLALSTTAHAQRYLVQDFINSGITSIQVSNTIPVTNILSVFAYSTNTVGIIYTNSNIRITTAAGDSASLFHDVATHPTGDLARQNTNSLNSARIVVTFASGAIGTSESCMFTFSQVPDGENEQTTVAELFGFGFVGVNSTTSTFSTNIPGWFASSAKIRFVGMLSTSTNAAVKVKSIRFVDVVP